MSKQKQLPTKPHLQALKKQARQLLNAHQAGQPQAANRIRSYLPRLRPATNAAILQNSFTLLDFSSLSKSLSLPDVLQGHPAA